MSPPTNLTVSRRDLGFVTAKLLALIAFRATLSFLFEGIFSFFSSFYESSRGPDRFQLFTDGVYLGFGIISTFIGMRLWFGAEKFGTSPELEPDDSTVVVSRNLLLQGIFIGTAVITVSTLAPETAAVIASLWTLGPGNLRNSLSPHVISDGLVRILFAVVLVVWARKLDRSLHEIPTE